MDPDFDYVIIGGGMAGLLLVEAMIDRGLSKRVRIAVIETRAEYTRDRIWSFWNVLDRSYQPIQLGKWDRFSVSCDQDQLLLQSEYPYVSIDSGKFYESILSKIDLDPNVEIMLGTGCRSLDDDLTGIITVNLSTGESITTTQVFDSRPPTHFEPGPFDLLQHFKGVHIRSQDPVFDPNQVTLMDFRVDQQWGLHFMYVLPLSDQEALVEATWFSADLVSEEIYDRQIENYLQSRTSSYELIYEEQGVIPMSLNLHQVEEWSNVVAIGTRGGLTRPSTGYTFLSAQVYADRVVDNLVEGRKEVPQIRSPWTEYMDEVLLRVLSKYPQKGPEIFVGLFKRNKPERIIKFLSGTSRLGDDLIMMIKIPSKLQFLKEGILAVLSRLNPRG